MADKKNKNPREFALDILNNFEGQKDYTHHYLDHISEKDSGIDNRDKAFISNLVQGVLRWKLRLDWIISGYSKIPLTKLDPPVLNMLRLAVYQIFFLKRVPDSAAVNEAVNQAKRKYSSRHAAPFVNAVLRNICRRGSRIPFPDKNSDILDYLSIYFSFPRWLVEKWFEEIGVSCTEELLPALNEIPSVNIRTNTLKTDREALMEFLSAEGVKVKSTGFSPVGIILEEFRGRVDKLDSFKKGLFQVQDQAAQITSYILAPEPGEKVLDVGAGLGG